jgi:Common central domain of tyrosinase
MRQTRRGFVGGAAALGAGAMVPWSAALAQTHPTRQSLSSFSRDPTRVASLRRGVAVMKARAPSDPKSWFFQAATHAYNDAAYADALTRDSGVARVDAGRFWNKCPHFGQSSADFLIWHRAFIYNFERVLRDAAGDSTLALPYWDYSKPEGREFPAIFADEFLDRAGRTPNPLYHPNRESAFVTGRFDISDAVGEASATMTAANFFSDVGRPGFAGDTLDSQHTQLGLIEQRPHNDIHIAVGGAIGTVNGAMADIPTAAFDPVFWVHHANIDRLWAEWSCMPGKGWGPMPPDAWLDEEPWEFMDVGGGVARGSRRFYIDRINIAVFYDTDKSHGPPMPLPRRLLMAEAPPPPPPPPPPRPSGAPSTVTEERAGQPAPVMRAMKASAPPAHDRELVADATPVVASPRAPAARRFSQAIGGLRGTNAPVAVGAAPPPPAGGAMESIVAPTPVLRRRVILELGDITFARTPSSGFAVYLASADDVAAKRRGTFVGLIDLFGVTHAHVAGMAGMGAVQRFDVTNIVAREGLGLTIRIEPYDLLVSKSGHAAPKRDDAVKIGSVRFVETA